MKISIPLKSTSSVNDVVEALKLLVAVISLLNTLGSEFLRFHNMLKPLKSKLLKAKQKNATPEIKALPSPELSEDDLQFETSMSSKIDVKLKLLSLLDQLIAKLTKMGSDFFEFISALKLLKKRVQEYAK